MQFRKLSQEESQERATKKGRKNSVDLTEYKEQIQSLGIGEEAEVTYDDGDSRRKHVLNFNRAAKELNVKLAWDYTRGSNVAFVRLVGSADEHSSNGQSDAPRRGRRPRKVAEPEAVAA